MSTPQPAVLNDYVQRLIRVKARYLARQPGFCRSDEEDLRQEITLRLLARAHHFDARRASLHTFADRVIASLVISLLRERRCHKRAPGSAVLSLDSKAPHTEDDPQLLRDHLRAADLRRRFADSDPNVDAERAAAVRAALGTLPPALRRICEHLMDGPPMAVARQLGLTRHEVQKAITALRHHFRAAGCE